MSEMEQQDTTSNTDTCKSQDTIVSGRRKFLKGAAAATPILLSVASRPVWARNCSLSGQLSGNLSDQSGDICAGEGCSQGYWRHRGYQVGGWHPEFYPDRPFDDVFGRQAFPGKTLYDVLDNRCKPEEIKPAGVCSMSQLADKKKCINALRQLGVQAVAGILNSASPLRYDLEVTQVIQSFQVAYDNGTPEGMEQTKDAFERLNTQRCPL